MTPHRVWRKTLADPIMSLVQLPARGRCPRPTAIMRYFSIKTKKAKIFRGNVNLCPLTGLRCEKTREGEEPIECACQMIQEIHSMYITI